MKLPHAVLERTHQSSPPSRGVWIETGRSLIRKAVNECRPPRGGCGLKLEHMVHNKEVSSRPPRGGCGLKQTRRKHRGDYKSSPPSRGVWIETERLEQQQQMLARRPPRGGCGLKQISLALDDPNLSESPPSRGVWIEIAPSRPPVPPRRVAPLAGGVD